MTFRNLAFGLAILFAASSRLLALEEPQRPELFMGTRDQIDSALINQPAIASRVQILSRFHYSAGFFLWRRSFENIFVLTNFSDVSRHLRSFGLVPVTSLRVTISADRVAEGSRLILRQSVDHFDVPIAGDPLAQVKELEYPLHFLFKMNPGRYRRLAVKESVGLGETGYVIRGRVEISAVSALDSAYSMRIHSRRFESAPVQTVTDASFWLPAQLETCATILGNRLVR